MLLRCERDWFLMKLAIYYSRSRFFFHVHPPKITGSRYGMKLKCPVMSSIWSHSWCVWCHKNEKWRQHSTSIAKGKFSFISFLEPVLFVHNFWPVNSDWLSKWTICVCAEVHFRGLTYFKICKCKWSFGALWQNFLKITQSILDILNKSSRRRNILSFPNLPER